MEKKNWDGICRCGHLHSEHGSSGSINYTAGRCSIKECKCLHFIHHYPSEQQSPPSVEPAAETEEIRCFNCGSINTPDKDGIFRKKCWYCKNVLESGTHGDTERMGSSPSIQQEAIPEAEIAPILKLSEWLNKELVWQESHVKNSPREFHKGALSAFESVAAKILELTAALSLPSVKPPEMRSLTPEESEVLDKTMYRLSKKEPTVKTEREESEEWHPQDYSGKNAPSPIVQEGETSKMSDELAALSDAAALEYGEKHGRETQSYYDNGADLTDAHEAGQVWMYRKICPTPHREKTGKQLLYMDQQIKSLQSQLSEAKIERDYARHASIEMQRHLQSQLYNAQQDKETLRQEVLAAKAEIDQLNQWRKDDKAYKEMLEDKLANLDSWYVAVKQERDDYRNELQRLESIRKKSHVGYARFKGIQTVLEKYIPQTPTNE